MAGLPAEAITLAAAELMALLTRTADVTIALKRSSERTDAEEERVRRGLRRELILDFVLYVPASAALLLLTVRPMLPADLMSRPYSHALLGTIAYAFPFTAFKKAALYAVLRSLSGFMAVLSETEKADLLKQQEKPKNKKRAGGADA